MLLQKAESFVIDVFVGQAEAKCVTPWLIVNWSEFNKIHWLQKSALELNTESDQAPGSTLLVFISVDK